MVTELEPVVFFFFFPFTIFIFSSYKDLTWLVENLENTNNKNEKKNTHL